MEDTPLESRSSRSVALIAILAVLDTASVLGALVVAAYMTRPEGIEQDLLAYAPQFLPYLVAFVIVWPIMGSHNRLFISRRRDDLLSLVFDVAKCVALSLIFTGFVVAFYTKRGAEPSYLSYFGLNALGFIAFSRVALQVSLWTVRSRGLNERHIIVVGANDRSRHLVQIIQNHPHYGYRIAGILDDDSKRALVVEDLDVPFLGHFDDLIKVLKEHVVDEVYICLPVRSRYETIQQVAHLCEDVGVSVRMVADLFPLRLATSRFHKLEDIPILALSTVPENQPQLILQRTTDVIAALILLGLFGPLF